MQKCSDGRSTMTSTATARGKARKSEVTPYQMYIDGKFVDAESGKTFNVYDPSTEGVVATVPAGGPKDVDRAVKAAHRAFYEGGWKGVSAQERGRILFRLAELAELETINSGKPIVESEYDMDTPPPATSTTAASPPRSTARCCRCPPRPSPSPCASRWAWPARSSPGTIRCSW